MCDFFLHKSHYMSNSNCACRLTCIFCVCKVCVSNVKTLQNCQKYTLDTGKNNWTFRLTKGPLNSPHFAFNPSVAVLRTFNVAQHSCHGDLVVTHLASKATSMWASGNEVSVLETNS